MRESLSNLNASAWQERLSAIFGFVKLDAIANAVPDSVIHQRWAGYELVTGTGPPARFIKPPKQGKPDGRLCLFAVDSGRVHIQHAGHRYDLADGQLAIFEQSLDISFDYDCHYAVRSLLLPPQLIAGQPALSAALGNLNAPHDGDSGYGRMIRCLLDELSQMPIDETPDTRAAVDVLGYTIRQWLRANTGCGDRVDCRLERIRIVVETRCTDPDFDRQSLANSVGMSVRSLSRFLSDAGTSARELIMTARLDRACALLSSPLCSGATFAQVADQAGFADYQHFVRAFGRHTGSSPTEFWKRSVT